MRGSREISLAPSLHRASTDKCLNRRLHTPFFMQGAKGRGVDRAKVATVMTVVHAYTVRISQSLGGLVKRNSAVRRGSALKCKITR